MKERIFNTLKENPWIIYYIILIGIILWMPISFTVDGWVRDSKNEVELKQQKFEARVEEAKNYCSINQEISAYEKPLEYQDCIKTYLKVTEPNQYNKKFLF